MTDHIVPPKTPPDEAYRQIRLPPWLWAAFTVFIGPALYLAGSPTPAGVVLAFTTIGIAIAHATAALGLRAASAFLTICLAITFTTENLSVATGIPFGHYHFVVGAGLPHIGAIPVIVGFLYFGLGYPSWVVAGVLLDRAGLQPDNRFRLLALPLVASFVMVQWDVVMDPPSSTLGRAWIWHDGGGYFGVPLSNYIGWYLTVSIFFQSFAYWQFSRRNDRGPQAVDPKSLFWLIPIILYLGAGLCQIVPLLTTGDEVVVDAADRHWRARDLRETMVIVMTATMLATSVLALLRWFEGSRR
jgi:putative membrane protein